MKKRKTGDDWVTLCSDDEVIAEAIAEVIAEVICDFF